MVLLRALLILLAVLIVAIGLIALLLLLALLVLLTILVVAVGLVALLLLALLTLLVLLAVLVVLLALLTLSALLVAIFVGHEKAPLVVAARTRIMRAESDNGTCAAKVPKKLRRVEKAARALALAMSVSSKILIHVNDGAPGLLRKRSGAGFSYVDAKGHAVRAAATLARIRALAIPPAWRDVWICADARGHLQATGRDARGRKQYRYHAAFRTAQENHKFAHLAAFAAVLPKIRRRVARDLRRAGLPREKVLATVVHLLETTLIRVGNADYARDNNSFGLTTLRDAHVAVKGSALRFHFKGKSGKVWRLSLSDRRVAATVRACQDLPGQHLFQYQDDDGALHAVSSSDINRYLREISGRDVTAKEFRTWAGTVLAAAAFRRAAAPDSARAAKREINAVIAAVAERLGNTVAICRKCYVHPAVVEAFQHGRRSRKRAVAGLRADEAAALAFLRAA